VHSESSVALVVQGRQFWKPEGGLSLLEVGTRELVKDSRARRPSAFVVNYRLCVIALGYRP
jgi:hypothetical protein